MKHTTVKIDEKIWATLRELSKEDGRQMKWHADRALSNYLKSKKKGGASGHMERVVEGNR